MDSFEFLNPVDGETYTLPAYDPQRYVDDFEANKGFIPPMPPLSDLALAEDPDALRLAAEATQNAFNWMMKRTIAKTVRAHFDSDADPAWVAIKALMDVGEWSVLAKVFVDWRSSSDDVEREGDRLGEG